jgi:hypothetical protein
VYAVITVGAVLGAVYGYKISKKVGA